LKDQNLSSIIKVVAVDKVGNRREAELAARNLPQEKQAIQFRYIVILSCVVILFILFFFLSRIFIKWRNRK